MMRYALIADIHANLDALRAVLADIERQNCGHIACLGDIVGFDANPKECLDIIRSRGIACIKGDHDEYCSTNVPLDDFNREAAAHIGWTREQLNEADRKWLRELPYSRAIEDFMTVHASLDRPQRWANIFDETSAGAHFARQTSRVCFFGHTHVPMAFVRKDTVHGGPYTELKLEENAKYLVNAGSVGQSREGVNQANYAVYDLDAQVIRLRCVDYVKSALSRRGGRAMSPAPEVAGDLAAHVGERPPR
jgi:predicted phosphodiesterase